MLPSFLSGLSYSSLIALLALVGVISALHFSSTRRTKVVVPGDSLKRVICPTCANQIIKANYFSLKARVTGSGSDKPCAVCGGKGGVNCGPCKGTGIDKVNGNVFERWTCNKCKGFGFIPCKACNGKSIGLTPEQRGER